MSNMETNDFYSTLLNDAWTVYMTFSGILISIITLLYSVILGKRSELEVYAEQTKLGHSDPMMRKQHQITIKVIKKLVSMLKTEDIHPPKTGISVHFSGSLV